MNKAYDIDLSKGRIKAFQLDAADQALYLGGRGIAARLLYDHTEAGLDPLSEEMVVIFSTGPVTGTQVPQSNRFVVTTKSPLTGTITSPTCGGHFAAKLKCAGVDLVLVRGKANHPVYVEITEQGATIKDAGHLWGQGTQETQKRLPRGFGKVVIGPAGENLVRYACVVSGNRVAGRTGIGAVLGAKHLKGIIANGNRKVAMTRPDGIKTFRKSMTQFLRADLTNPSTARNTSQPVSADSATDDSQVKVGTGAMTSHYLKKKMGCLNCPIICGRGIALRQALTGEAEVESVAALAPNIGDFDAARVLELNFLCDELGMDSISTGGAIAFAMKLIEKGLMKSDRGVEALQNSATLVRDIAFRRGLGNELADGVKTMSEKFGIPESAIDPKDPAPCVDTRSGTHDQDSEPVTRKTEAGQPRGAKKSYEALGPLKIDPMAIRAKPELVILQQNLSAAISSSIFCKFSAYAMIPSFILSLNPQGIAYDLIKNLLLHASPVLSLVLKLKAPVPLLWFEKFISAMMGRRISMGAFAEIGERIINLERLYDLREGLTKHTDTFAHRLASESTFSGAEMGFPLDDLLPHTYRLRGWDEEGRPKAATLKRLRIKTGAGE